MKVLVTGANGFMGSHLVKSLIDNNHEVISLVLKGTNETYIRDLDCEIRYGDVMQSETLKDPLKNVELVYHLAAIPSSGWSKKIYKVNYEGTKILFNEALKANVKRFVYMSSLVVHGFKHFDGADESIPLLKPKWYRRPYAKSKIRSELFLRENSDKMEVVIIRPGFMPFGENDILSARELYTRIDSGKTVPNINQGKSKISYIYVKNLCDGLILAGNHPKAAGQTYLLTDNKPPFLTLKKYMDVICDELEQPHFEASIPYRLAAIGGALMDFIFRIFARKKIPIISMYTLKLAKFNLNFQSDKAKNDLGFETKVPFDEAIKRTIDWYKSDFK